jgi:hypothetical protein
MIWKEKRIAQSKTRISPGLTRKLAVRENKTNPANARKIHPQDFISAYGGP